MVFRECSGLLFYSKVLVTAVHEPVGSCTTPLY